MPEVKKRPGTTSNEIKPDEPAALVEEMDLSHFSEEETGPVTSWAKRFGLLVFEIVKVVLISLAIILPVRLFLVQPFYVEGASMEPNFHASDYLIIDELSYRFHQPQRGEVIIFKNPRNHREYFIKRVIGLPGESVEVKDGRVFVNGKELAEAYIKHFSIDTYSAVKLADNHYFVMGDNRTNSLDSRQIGSISKEAIIGRVWVRGWPLDKMNTFNLPDYNQ